MAGFEVVTAEALPPSKKAAELQAAQMFGI